MSSPGDDAGELILGCVGAHAAARIASAREGRVRAQFERSAYVELGGQWMCIGGEGLGRGPLNALAFAPAALRRWLAMPMQDAAVRGEWPLYRVAGTRLDFARAAHWRAPLPSLPVDPARLARGVARLRTAARTRIPREGLAFLVAATAAPGALADAGGAAAGALHAWLGNTETPPPDALRSLIGLGPGLTPSGDDFLGGALIALHALGRSDMARRLGDWLLPRCAGATHPISAAHVAAAAEGEGGEALHACLLALACDRDPDAALDAIASVGHTSGWDALAGATTVASAIGARRVA